MTALDALLAANAVLVRIDNPETLAKREQAVAAKVVADAQLANINVGTRPEVIAAREAALYRASGFVLWHSRDLSATPTPTNVGNWADRIDQIGLWNRSWP